MVGLVHVDAQIQLPGETAAQLTNLYPGSKFGAALVARPITLPGGGTGTDLYVDQAIPPAGQRFMARRAHARVTEIPGAPHVSMLPYPKQVTAVIEAASR